MTAPLSPRGRDEIMRHLETCRARREENRRAIKAEGLTPGQFNALSISITNDSHAIDNLLAELFDCEVWEDPSRLSASS